MTNRASLGMDQPLVSARDFHAMRIEAARRSFGDFARLMAPRGFIFGASHCWLFDGIDKWIAGDFTRMQINLIPRFGKSMLGSVFLPAFLIGCFPSRKIIHLCNNLELTRQFSEQLVALLQSEEYKEVFPWVEFLDVSTGRINFRDRRDERGEWGRYYVTSIKKNTSGHGAHFLLVDDPIVEGEAQSKLIKESIWARWSQGFVTRLAPEYNRILMIGTRFARDDLFGRVIAQSFEDDRSEPWKIFKIPIVVDREQAAKVNAAAERDPIFRLERERGYVRPLTPNGTCSPERFDIDFAERKKAELPPEQYASLYLQSPSPEQGTVFRKSMFQPLGREMMAEMRARLVSTYLTADLALKAEERSDFSAFLHVGVIPQVVKRGRTEFIQQTLVLLDAEMDRIPPADLPKMVRKLYAKWRPHRLLIEDAASGSLVIQALRRIGLPIDAFNPRKMPRSRSGKEERAHLAAVYIAQQPIFYDENNANVKAIIQQTLEFPRSDKDDAVDALTQLILYLKFRNEFDSSFDTYADEVAFIREDIESEDDDDDARAALPADYRERSIIDRVANPYRMTPAQRQRWLRERDRDRTRKVDPYDARDGIRFDDD